MGANGAHKRTPFGQTSAAVDFPDVIGTDRPADVLPADQLRRCRLAVASHATDAADLTDLLEVLGLDEMRA